MLVRSIFTFNLLSVFSQLWANMGDVLCYLCTVTVTLSVTRGLHMSQGPGARPAGCSLPGVHSEWEEQTAAQLQDHVHSIGGKLGRAAAGSEETPVSLEQGIISEVTPGLALAHLSSHHLVNHRNHPSLMICPSDGISCALWFASVRSEIQHSHLCAVHLPISFCGWFISLAIFLLN